MKSMRIEAKLFLALVPFFVVMTLIYGFWSEFNEPVGLVGIGLTGGLCAFIGFYLWMNGNKILDRPDDNPDGEISDLEGDYGTFAPHSWTPLLLAGAMALAFFGVAIGWWLVIIAVPLVGVAVVLWTFEYFTGKHAQ